MLVSLVLLGLTDEATAGPCDAWYAFDGTLVDTGGNGYDGQMIASDGTAPAPIFVAGRVGQALHLDGTSAMRALLDLHFEACPQVTITAWIRVAQTGQTGAEYVLSTGNGNGPGIRIMGERTVVLDATANGLWQRDAIRDSNEWFFVAGVYDYDADTYTLHWRNRTAAGTINPRHSPPEDSLWVGAFNDGLSGLAAGIDIDELRFYGRVLTANEVAELQAAGADNAPGTAVADAPLPSCNDHIDCAPGNYCAWDNTCHPESHAPKQKMELLDAGPSAENFLLSEDARGDGMTQEELTAMFAEWRSENYGDGIVYESPAAILDAAKAASSESEETATARSDTIPGERDVIGWTLSSTEVQQTPVSGTAGNIVVPVELNSSILTGLVIFEPNNVPCYLSLIGDDTKAGIMRCTPSLVPMIDASILNSAKIEPAAVESLRVCSSIMLNDRVKGISISGHRIEDDGSPGFYQQAKADGPNCTSWEEIVACDSGYVATGVVAHFKDRDLSDSLTGLQLICRKIRKIYR